MPLLPVTTSHHELSAIGRPCPAGQPCLVGSVKSTLGHHEAAGGLTGSIELLSRSSIATSRRPRTATNRPLRRSARPSRTRREGLAVLRSSGSVPEADAVPSTAPTPAGCARRCPGAQVPALGQPSFQFMRKSMRSGRTTGET
ncbi:hypothetical protein [Nocardia jejuensis]|uniref:hypothetical protein n=1 Tax=Nocardia jejuensis TaxID=328049 RepID=UPI000A0501FC